MNLQQNPLKPISDPPREISEWRDRFESVLAQWLPPGNEHPGMLHEAMRYSALAGGKRFRPVLVYATGKALGLAYNELDSVACAIELIHTYSLIHDDLPAMDNDDMRRGQATCHCAFDEATAILAGDALQALAFEILAAELSDRDAAGLEVIRLVAQACGSTGMAGGQALDLNSVGCRIELDSLETMHRLKTGALIRAAVVAPCILAGAETTTRQQIDRYGEYIGLAFQIHDDVLDVTGDSEITGKNTQADAALDKPTFPSLLGLEESRIQAESMRDRAIDSLVSVPGDLSILIWLADYVIRRDR